MEKWVTPIGNVGQNSAVGLAIFAFLSGEVVEAALRFHHSPTPIQVLRLSSTLDRMHG